MTLGRIKIQGIFKLAEYQTGKFLGDDDYFSDSNLHFGTATCSSRTGTVYQISVSDFKTKILNKYDMKQQVQLMVEEKEDQIKQRINMIDGIYKITPNQIKEEVQLQAKAQQRNSIS